LAFKKKCGILKTITGKKRFLINQNLKKEGTLFVKNSSVLSAAFNDNGEIH